MSDSRRDCSSWMPSAAATAAATPSVDAGGGVIGGADVGEADQPDAVGVVAHARRGGFDGEPGLAAAAGADEGDQASLVEQVADLGHRLHAADEGGDRLGQVVGVLADRLQRGELPLEAFGLDLEEADRFGHVAQLVETQVDELDAVAGASPSPPPPPTARPGHRGPRP